ncbi:hypothetical protein [Bacteroides neonati]|uniref:hypothetical protein n=1 Tax=Bacteroides neonati TaxID=1347393 RepID=UPI0005AB31AF|nr:hypothetical protein [Bacteroides neonati]
MDIKELAKWFISGAPEMCGNGQSGLMNALSIDDLVTEYWRGIDFCLAKDYPRLQVMKKFKKELRTQHIYIGEEVKLENETKAAFLFNCKVDFTANEYAVSRIYAKHNSLISIRASGHAFVMVDALDSSILDIECIEEAKVIINMYARSSVRSSVGQNIKTVYKNLETYDL